MSAGAPTMAQVRQAAELVITAQNSSGGFLMRKLPLTGQRRFMQSGVLLDELEALDVVGPAAVGPRTVLVHPDDLNATLARIIAATCGGCAGDGTQGTYDAATRAVGTTPCDDCGGSGKHADRVHRHPGRQW